MHGCALAVSEPRFDSCRCLSAKTAPVAQRTLLVAKAAADNATGQEAGVTETKDLKEDIIFKPFEEVHFFYKLRMW